MNMKTRDLEKKIEKFKIIPPRSSESVEVKVIITSVIDNGNNYWIQGKFYDDGNFYFYRTWFYKDEDSSHIDFIPWPKSAILDSEMEYIEKMRS
jgi:hypothetical protein